MNVTGGGLACEVRSQLAPAHHRSRSAFLEFRLRILVPLLLATCFAGCDSGVQRGKFTVSGSRGGALENDAGWITRLVGTPYDTPSAKDQLLIAVVWTGDEFDPSGTSTSHQTFVSTHEVSTETGTATIEWDRRTDIVSVCGTEYRRTAGNVFVVRMTDAGVSAKQIEGIVESTSSTAIIDAVKGAFPHDSEIRALTAMPDAPD